MDHHLLNVSPRLSFQFCYSSAELLNEIITIEDEITYLERYLLSLYREAFNQSSHSFSGKCETDLQNKILSEARIITDQSCSTLESNFSKDVPVHHPCISSVRASTDSDDWNRVGMLKPSTQRDRVVVEHGHRSLADYLVASRIENNLNRPDSLSSDAYLLFTSNWQTLLKVRKGFQLLLFHHPPPQAHFLPGQIHGALTSVKKPEVAKFKG